MSFANPWMLLALLLPAAAAWLARRRQRGARPLLPAMGRVSVGSDNRVHAAQPRKSDPAYLIIAAVALGCIAAARPQWGEQPDASFSQSIEVVIALDLSRSMGAPDMPGGTTRLRAAKATVDRLLNGMRGENVGLVVFAGTAFVQVPMSPDYQIIREFLPALDPNYMPVGGSGYDRMLGAALEAFGQANDRDRYLLVLSDGETTGPGFEPRIPDLLRHNIHVIGIGFGSEQGANIPDPKGGPLLDKKNGPVLSRLTPGTLESLATRTEGTYVAATALPDDAAVRKLIQRTVEPGRAGRVRNGRTQIGVERFQWFLFPAVLLSLVSLTREFRRHAPPRAVHPAASPVAGPGAGTQDKAAQTLAAGLSAVLLVLGLAAPPARAHHDAQAGFEVKEDFKGDPAQRVRAIAAHMGRFGYDALDLKLYVEAALRFGASERARGRLPLASVMSDAADAARVGKRLDPKRAQWDHYDAEIHALLAPLPVEAKEKEPENDGKDEEDDDDEQNYKPAPLRKAKDKEGKDLFGKNTRSRSEFALGDLSGDETFAPQEPHGGHRRPPKPPQAPAPVPGTAPAEDPQIAEARKNFAIVVKGDSPGRVHHLLNGAAEKRTVDQDW